MSLVESPHPSAQKTVGTISSLLQPFIFITDVIRRVLDQQQSLRTLIEVLNDELQNDRLRFDASNGTQRHHLDIYCAKVARCRSEVAVLLRRLMVIKERLVCMHQILLQRNKESSSKNTVFGGGRITSDEAPYQGLPIPVFTVGTVISAHPLGNPEDVEVHEDQREKEAEVPDG